MTHVHNIIILNIRFFGETLAGIQHFIFIISVHILENFIRISFMNHEVTTYHGNFFLHFHNLNGLLERLNIILC